MLDPRAARYGDRVELVPVVALAVDDRMTAAAERRSSRLAVSRCGNVFSPGRNIWT